MGQFEIKAKSTMMLEGGRRIEKGATFTINTSEMGIKSFSLFTSPERRESATKQLEAQGISGVRPHQLNAGCWDIKERK